MKTWLNGTFYNALPTDLKNVITACTKYTDNTGKELNTYGVVTGTSQKIWLLAEYEVFGENEYTNQYEQDSQAQYDYYKNGNSRVRYAHNDTATSRYCWLRSPSKNSALNFVGMNRVVGHFSRSASCGYGFVPFFTIS